MKSNNGQPPTQFNVRDAALHGASVAFSKPSVPPKPLVNTHTGGGNGALLAATKVGASPLTKDWTGGSSRRPDYSPRRTNSSSTLGVPDTPLERGPSPSNIAARLAAARHSPMRPPPATAAPIMSERAANERDVLPPSGSVGNVLARLESNKPVQIPRKRRDSLGSQSVASTARLDEPPHKSTYHTRTPPLTSSVNVIGHRRPTTPIRTVATPLNVAQASPPPVRSPKPQRTFNLPPEPEDHAPLVRARTHTPPPVKPKPKHHVEMPTSQYTGRTSVSTDSNLSPKDPLKSPPIKQKPPRLARLTTTTTPPKPPKPPLQRSSSWAVEKSDVTKSSGPAIRLPSTSVDGGDQDPSSPASFKSAKEVQEEDHKQKPNVPPPRRSTRKPNYMPPASEPRSVPTAPAHRSQRNQSSPMLSPERLSSPRRPSPASVYHNNYQRDSVKQISKHMTGESLSSAIMGAALASSRNVSPAPPQRITPEPLFPPRKHHHHHLPFHRSPSPPKQSPPKSVGKMRTTMRKEPSSSDSDENNTDKYKKHGTRIMGIKGRKHPNKHHEGTRKRWRDQITERERKRYEGVWAANKGLFSSSLSASPYHFEDDPAGEVSNLAVQDIWARSRLPEHVLEEVWDLVDSRGIGWLKRDEFVVGLWLIDQRLKGRKLPIKVSESVWTSARGVGIKVKVRH